MTFEEFKTKVIKGIKQSKYQPTDYEDNIGVYYNHYIAKNQAEMNEDRENRIVQSCIDNIITWY